MSNFYLFSFLSVFTRVLMSGDKRIISLWPIYCHIVNKFLRLPQPGRVENGDDSHPVADFTANDHL
jgi:hypothetical protein